jgi:sulfur carrier protein ThiS
MPKALLHYKDGGTEQFEIPPGIVIRDFLRSQGIPSNAVLTAINKDFVSENATVEANNDLVEFEQVRHYDLDVTRRPPRRDFGIALAPVYAKSVLFDHQGAIEVQSESFDKNSFPSYIETAFVESVTKQGLLFEGMHAAVGLSGGRDSVAFLTLLERSLKRLPRVSLTAITVTGLPDWDESGTFGAAIGACRNLGIDHIIVEAGAITERFALQRPFVDIMTEIVAGETGWMVMVATHHVMRRMIEVEAHKRNIDQIFLGLNADDLVASLVTWMTAGFQMGSIPVRRVGNFTYSYPLYHVTKKELTLYLKLVAPDLTRQGVPGRFTTGPAERSLAYAITDHLYDLWGGIDYYLFDAYARMAGYQIVRSEEMCGVCGASYTLQEGIDNQAGICDVCTLFQRYNNIS